MTEIENGGCGKESGASRKEGVDVLFEDNTELLQLATHRKKARACIPCRQLKKKCDFVRPCGSCWARGAADSCLDDKKTVACSLCRSRRLKCDRQRPCSRCVRVGQGDACTSTSYLSMDLRYVAGASTSVPSGSPYDSDHSATYSGEVSSHLHSEDRSPSSAKSNRIRGIVLQVIGV